MSTNQLPTSPPQWFHPSHTALIYDAGDRKVYKVDDEYILKRTPVVGHNAEAATHAFINERTNVPAPLAYAEWESPDRRFHYLLEGRIAGQTLHDCWGRLDPDTKISLARQVVAMMGHLARFPGRAMQSLAGGRLPNNCFIPVHPRAPMSEHRAHLPGQWSTDAQIFAQGFAPALQRAGVSAPIVSLAASTMPPCAGQLVLTHGDLYLGNIMVDAARGRVTAIIDWESAGFWPAWFQHARITHGCSDADNEWKEIMSMVQEDLVPHADHGRVWWEAVRALVHDPGSRQARAWLALLTKYITNKVGIPELRAYESVGGGSEVLGYGGSPSGYYSTAIGTMTHIPVSEYERGNY